jgi:hypothetical protein
MVSPAGGMSKLSVVKLRGRQAARRNNVKTPAVAARPHLNEESIAGRSGVDSIRSPAHVVVRGLFREQVRTALLFQEKEQTG